MKIKAIITDIEGTTTDIDFVKKVLFPYSKKHLSRYIEENVEESHVQEVFKDLDKICEKENIKASSVEEKIQVLTSWIEQDRKAPPLKKLQGYIWKSGYEREEFKSHLYDEVPKYLQKWKETDSILLGIYSSGSVNAQKLLFRHTAFGDLNPLFDFYFDTEVGHKKEVKSYKNILGELKNYNPEEVLFLSDIPEELKAAKEAGMQTCQLLRPGNVKDENFKLASDFAEVDAFID